jgi:hypothetical protein
VTEPLEYVSLFAPSHPHAVKASAIGFGALFLVVALNVLAVHFGLIHVPPNTIPWRAPKLDSRPGLFVHFQMQNLRHDRQTCLAALDHASDLAYSTLSDKSDGTGCGFDDVVRLQRMPVAFNEPPDVTCSLAAALYWWQRDLQTIAAFELHTTIKRIDQVGSYSCRNVNHAAAGPRSEHATANAIDVDAFETADGRRITVASDWGKPTPEGRFLREARDSACGVFGEVLGPDYNALHAAHFHLDESSWTMCR